MLACGPRTVMTRPPVGVQLEDAAAAAAPSKFGVFGLLADAILSLGYATAAGESESGQSNEMAAERTRWPTFSSDAHFRCFGQV